MEPYPARLPHTKRLSLHLQITDGGLVWTAIIHIGRVLERREALPCCRGQRCFPDRPSSTARARAPPARGRRLGHQVLTHALQKGDVERLHVRPALALDKALDHRKLAPHTSP